MGCRQVDRRKFLITSGLGVVGAVLMPTDRAYASPVFGAVRDFANSVEASLTANSIASYLSSQGVDSSTADEVQRANNAMAQNGGFNDLTESSVYVPAREHIYFFYPARNIDKFNVCVAFLNRGYNPGSRLIALIEGPTLFGIGGLAIKLAQQQPHHVVRRTLLPRETIQRSGGLMNRSYDRPDIYRTDEGTVRAHYTSDGSGKGTVTVEAKNERGTLLAGGEYPLKYNTSE
jgi:hypothetical protein